MKVLITEIRQESNSFNPLLSGLAHWKKTGWVLEPNEVRDALKGVECAVGGMIEVLEASLERFVSVVEIVDRARISDAGNALAQQHVDPRNRHVGAALDVAEPPAR